MENKQLERELRSIVQGLKGTEILKIIDLLQTEEAVVLNTNYTKSGLNCTCCTLIQDQLIATGFGRNQQEALINATKNYLETLITTNTLVPQLKNCLKLRQSPSQPNPLQVQKKDPKIDQTLDLDGTREIGDLSVINQPKEGCSCIYYEVHKHHMAQIKNMEVRMKLLIKENEMLKQLLLKDAHRSTTKVFDKENMYAKANLAQN